MKKILFILVASMIISSCTTEKNETTFIVKFKDGTEIEVVGIDASANRDAFYIYDKDYHTSVFANDEISYILKEQ